MYLGYFELRTSLLLLVFFLHWSNKINNILTCKGLLEIFVLNTETKVGI